VTPVPLLDTHAWIWWVEGDARLGRKTIEALDALPSDARPCISGISLLEVATLVNLGRLDFSESFENWLDAAADPRTVRVVPMSADIASEVARLPATCPRDPADRAIIATSRAMGYPLVSHDKAITQSRLVKRWSPEGAAS
jgi:PIN domain nuclease of toxin-antitoxin system